MFKLLYKVSEITLIHTTMNGKYNCVFILNYIYRFHTVEEMCSSVGIVPSMPRKCVRQTHRSNVPAETPSAYYRRSISIPHSWTTCYQR